MEHDTRAQALQQIVAIATEHGLTGAEISSALPSGAAAADEHRTRAVLVRVLGYLGGMFVFAGVGIFVALQWDAMSSAARVVITLGSGATAFALGVLACLDPRFEKAATPLFLVAAALEPAGMLVAFDEYGSGGDARWAALLTAGTVAVQFCVAFLRLRRSALLFLTIAFGTMFWWTAFDLLDVDDVVIALVVGATLLLAAAGIDRTPHATVTPLWYLIGGGLFLYGLFDAVEGTVFEILFLLVACGFVYLSVALSSRALLFVATAAVLAYTAWFTGEYFAESVGWPIALVVFGLVMIGLSALAFRIDRDYLRVPGRTSG